jgi:hypothetical protein
MSKSDIVNQLKILRKAALKVASAETAYLPEEYKSSRLSALQGHCGCVSWLVMQLYGGTIVTGKVDGIRHYWNRLPDGEEVDLTSCQFGGDGFTPLVKGRKVPRKLDGLTNPRYLVFYSKIMEEM